jgi:hypothetical protein
MKELKPLIQKIIKDYTPENNRVNETNPATPAQDIKNQPKPTIKFRR